MKSKTKNTKVPKSAKTRLSDLIAKKDALGGRFLTPPGGVVKARPDGGPDFTKSKKPVTLPPY